MMDKINILVDAHVFDGKYQGTRTYIRGLYNFYHDPRFNIYLISSSEENLKNHFILPNVNFIEYKYNNKLLRFLIEIPRVVKKYKIDLIHFQYILPPFCRCKKIVTIHDILFKDYSKYFPFFYKIKNNLLFGLSIRIADMVFTVSKYSQDRIIHHYKYKANQIKITPNAVEASSNISFSDSINFSDSILKKYNLNKYIINVSRFEPRKGQHLILQAFMDLDLFEKNYELVLIGHYDLKYIKFTDILKKLPDKHLSKIKVLNNIADEEMFTLIRNAKLFIYPSFAEGFGIPPLEAAIQQTPVICSNQTAMKEFTFFKDRMFDPYNYNEFLNKINQYLYNSNLDIKNIEQAIKEKYNWNKISKNFFELLYFNFSRK